MTATPAVEPDADRGSCRILSARLVGRAPQEVPHQVRTGETLELEIQAQFEDSFFGEPALGVGLLRQDGLVVYTTASSIDGFGLQKLGARRYGCKFRLLTLPLLSGSFSFTVFATDQHRLHVYDAREGIEPFEVTHAEADWGLTRLEHEWKLCDE